MRTLNCLILAILLSLVPRHSFGQTVPTDPTGGGIVAPAPTDSVLAPPESKQLQLTGSAMWLGGRTVELFFAKFGITTLPFGHRVQFVSRRLSSRFWRSR